MNMLIKKKQLLSATLVVALGAAVAVNWYYSEPLSEYETSTSTYEEVEGALGDSIYVAGTTSASEEENGDSEDEEQTQSVSVTMSEEEQEYFARAKLERETSHDEIIDNIQAFLENDNLSQSDKTEIQEMIDEFTLQIKAETDIQTLITAKTSSECIVIISDESIQVIMQQNTLTDTILLQIGEIIENNTDISAENLIIIEAK